MAEKQGVLELIKESGESRPCPVCGAKGAESCRSVLTGAVHAVYRHHGRAGHEQSMIALGASDADGPL